MKGQMILRVVAKLVMPYILLFALYVQFHGDYGPGGGFQAGVIFAAGIILYTLVFGLDRSRETFPERIIEWFVAGGLLLYIAVGLSGILGGRNFLDYSVLASDPVAGQHLGILLVELGVGITVAAVVVSIFFAFFDRGRH